MNDLIEPKQNKDVNIKQNSFSFRWGGPGTEVKIYFEDAVDLHKQLDKLNMNGEDIKLSMLSYIEKMKEESEK